MKMKFLLLVVLSLSGLYAQGQTPSMILKMTSTSTVFTQSIPVGSCLIDLENFKQYVTLRSLPEGGATSLGTCEQLLLNQSNLATAHINEVNVNGIEHHIGDFHLGGVIVAVWSESGVEHGLVVSKKDVWGIGIKWNNGGGDFNTSDLSGLANKSIITTTAAPANAINKAQIFVSEGTGWYLPALWELNACYSARQIVEQVLAADGDATTKGFKDGYYWSSSQDKSTSTNAWGVDFNNSAVEGRLITNTKGNSYFVRAVKRY